MFLKLTRTENCTVLQVLQKEGTKVKRSYTFYVSKSTLHDSITHTKDYELYVEGSYFDGDDTLRIYKDDNLTLLKFRFFNERERYDLHIDTQKFINFLEGEGDIAILHSARHEVKSKITLNSRKNLSEIINNRTLKKKFGRAIMRLQDCRHEEVVLWDDSMDYSFYFVKFFNDERDYNGGLIFHKDYEAPTNIGKGNFSIHT